MRALIALLLMLASPAPAQTQTVTLGDRSYQIALPAQPQNAPILMALHGGGGTPGQFARNSGLTQPATAAGYAVIYPAGSGRGPLLTWNGGYCCGYAMTKGIDDQTFLAAVAADAARRFGLNGQRLYLTGMSNGSIMAEAFAATHPAQVRAVAGVSGTLDLARFPPQGPVPLLHIHGTADPQVPYQGGKGSTGMTDTDFTAVPDVIDAFVTAQGPGLTHTTDTQATAGITRSTWSRNGIPQITLLTIPGGDHVWPGGKRARGTTPNLNANAEILAFFALHP